MNESKALSFAATLGSIVLVVASLFFAKEILIPFALAMLLSFLLAPLVRWLQRRRFPRVLAVITATILSFTLIGFLAWMISHEVLNLASDLPRYRTNLMMRIQSIRHPMGTSLDKTKDTVKDLSEELMKAGPKDSKASGITPVEVVDRPLTPFQIMREAIKKSTKPIGTAFIVIVFVFCILLKREDLRDRLIRLVGPGNLHVTTQALDDAAGRVSRYLMMLLLINSSFGVAVAIGLFFIGVPNALLWGALAAIMRFIPYVGVWLAAGLPTLLCLAVFNTWAPMLLTLGLFVILELLTNYLFEPWLYGSHTGLSSVALIVAAVVWTWLWGGIGLLLSTPLTVCLVVMGKYIPQLKFLDFILGDEPVLAPDERLYQRLVAANVEEAENLLEEQLKEKSPVELLDSVLVPALARAERDYNSGSLDEGRHRQLLEHVKEIVDELPIVPSEQVSSKQDAARLILLPAHSEADEVAAEIFASTVNIENLVTMVTHPRLVAEQIDLVRKHEGRIVCISALPPSAILHSRYICKRLRVTYPNLPIIVGLWNFSEDLEQARSRLTSVGADRVAVTLAEAERYVAELSQLQMVKKPAAS